MKIEIIPNDKFGKTVLIDGKELDFVKSATLRSDGGGLTILTLEIFVNKASLETPLSGESDEERV